MIWKVLEGSLQTRMTSGAGGRENPAFWDPQQPLLPGPAFPLPDYAFVQIAILLFGITDLFKTHSLLLAIGIVHIWSHLKLEREVSSFKSDISSHWHNLILIHTISLYY
jgi:hypothetical protein